jgi:diguanylate cyclase (GGDEF)-like protein
MSVSFSMRTSLWLTLAVMGLLAMILAVATGSVYSELALNRQTSALSELVKYKTDDLLKQLENSSYRLGTDMQYEADFRQAFARQDRQALQNYLNGEFHRFFETAGAIQLQKIYVLDTEFGLVGESSDKEGLATRSATVLCDQLVFIARHRRGAERLKPVSSICNTGTTMHFAVLAPIGGLKISGYIAVVSDPVYTLQKLSRELGMPVRMLASAGAVISSSDNWPPQVELDKFLLAEHLVTEQTGKTVMKIVMASDMKSLHADLQQARNMVLIVAGIVTVFCGVFFLILLQRTALQPLNNLINQIHRVLSDRSNLGEQVSVTGAAEIRDLATSFNTMTVELRDLYDTLDKLAFSDPLTGLPNRTLFNDRINQAIMICRRQKLGFALLMMDLNRFKQVNDSLGHAVGDELLKQVSIRMLGCLRKSDSLTRLREDSILARLGGDEFAALLPLAGAEDTASVVAKRLHAVMEAPFYIGENHFSVGVSIGVALFPHHGDDAITIMRHADMAMYEAKRLQKGLVFYNDQDDEASISRLTLESDLREAFDKNELEVYFQPKIDSKTEAVCGAEALLRWQHPLKGMVPPDQFIPLAEQAGLMQILTYYVLDKSLEQCALWHRGGFDLVVSVNVSAHSLRDQQIIEDVKLLLGKWSLDAHALCLELTESAVMAEPDKSIQVLNELSSLGVQLSIDDFGTGYSSLTYLQKLPVDEVKIDKSFVIGMDLQHNDNVIVRSTIDLAHNMNLRVVAEGVETAQVVEMLKHLGCEIMQGYYFSRPIPAIEFFRHLSDARWKISGLSAMKVQAAAATAIA